LSYTRFEYGDLAVDVDPTANQAVISVDVTNVGDRRGQEVVQLYVGDVEASVTRPQRELQQFAKVALEPGETSTVRLELSSRAFAFWDAQHHEWVVEPGEFEIAVGSSSRRIHRTALLRL
jgi:beta-glucosidase